MRKVRPQKPQIRFTQKAWDKFDHNSQEHLTKKFEIIITDYQTKKGRWIRRLKAIDITGTDGRKNLDRGIIKFQNGMDQFSKMMAELNEGMSFEAYKKRSDKVFGENYEKRDTSFLTGGNKTSLFGQEKKFF